jgi:hypothetical protein
MILVQQRYFAKPGLRDRVLDTRVEASHRLLELGVPAGQIWVPADDAGNLVAAGGPVDAGLPDLIWECTYRSLAEREQIRAKQESDPAFHAIRTRQGTQLTRWVREHYRLLDLK